MMFLTTMGKILILKIRGFWKITFQTFCQQVAYAKVKIKVHSLKLLGYLSTQMHGERITSAKVPD